MADPEKPKNGALTRIAERASWAGLLVVVACIGIAIWIEPGYNNACRMLAEAGFLSSLILTPLGLCFAIIALARSRATRTKLITTTFAGLTLTALLIHYGRRGYLEHHPTTACEACIANLSKIKGAKATWALKQKWPIDARAHNHKFARRGFRLTHASRREQ